MKKIVATFMSIVMMLAILVPSALAQTESQFYDQWYEAVSYTHLTLPTTSRV